MTEKEENAPLLPPPNTNVTHGMYVSMYMCVVYKKKTKSQPFPILLDISKIVQCTVWSLCWYLISVLTDYVPLCVGSSKVPLFVYGTLLLNLSTCYVSGTTQGLMVLRLVLLYQAEHSYPLYNY